jgi:hypothetical protein
VREIARIDFLQIEGSCPFALLGLRIGQGEHDRPLSGVEMTAPHLEAAAKERQKLSKGRGKKVSSVEDTLKRRRAPRVVNQIAEAAGVAHGNVSKGKKVQDASPTLAASVSTGTISLNDAHKQVRQAEASYRLRPRSP